mgnify:CR=1 FL=1
MEEEKAVEVKAGPFADITEFMGSKPARRFTETEDDFDEPATDMVSVVSLGLTNLPPETRALMATAMIKDAATTELQNRLRTVLGLPTPPNVLEQREGPGGQNLTYVKLGYMEETCRKHITSNYQFRTITPPTITPFDHVPSGLIVICYLELDIYIFGQLVETVPCPGTCTVRKADNGLDMAIKGAVTDAKKKGFSFLNIANDVYQYGDRIPLTDELVASYINSLKKEFPSIVTPEKFEMISKYMKGRRTVEDLQTAYFMYKEKMIKELEKEGK